MLNASARATGDRTVSARGAAPGGIAAGTDVAIPRGRARRRRAGRSRRPGSASLGPAWTASGRGLSGDRNQRPGAVGRCPSSPIRPRPERRQARALPSRIHADTIVDSIFGVGCGSAPISFSASDSLVRHRSLTAKRASPSANLPGARAPVSLSGHPDSQGVALSSVPRQQKRNEKRQLLPGRTDQQLDGRRHWPGRLGRGRRRVQALAEAARHAVTHRHGPVSLAVSDRCPRGCRRLQIGPVTWRASPSPPSSQATSWEMGPGRTTTTCSPHPTPRTDHPDGGNAMPASAGSGASRCCPTPSRRCVEKRAPQRQSDQQ